MGFSILGMVYHKSNPQCSFALVWRRPMYDKENLAVVYHYHFPVRTLTMASAPRSSAFAGAPRYPRVILASRVVPWAADWQFEEALFRRTVRHAATTLTPHLYIFGTAGEGHAVSDRQFEAITRAFANEMAAAGGVPMVGVISLSLRTLIERIEFAWSLGVREFQISLPAWSALEDVELDTFFAETCGRFPGARFLHYNLARTKRVLTGADYARLAARHPNLVAIKMGGENLAALREVAAAVPAVRCFFTEFAYASLRDATGCGLLCALSACEPVLARRLFSGDAKERAALEPTLRACHAAAMRALAGRTWTDGAYDKMYLKRHFAEFPLRLLPPYSCPSDEQFARFNADCDAALAALPASS